MKQVELKTIDDYVQECGRIKYEISRARSKRARRNWYKYLKRTLQKIQIYDSFKGTNYAANISL